MSLRRSLYSCSVLALLALGGLSLFASTDDPPAATGTSGPDELVTFPQHISPLLAKYCIKCHSGMKPKGNLALDAFKDEASILNARPVWEKVLQYVRAGEMPPDGRPKPTAAERELLAKWVGKTLAKVDTGRKDPGRVTMRRLNRAEYANTIRDLVGVNFQAGDDFPADDVGYGFDNIGDVLSIPPMLMEKYLAAAEKIMDQAIATEKAGKSAAKKFTGRELKTTLTADTFKNDARNLFTNGEAFTEFAFPKDGDYRIGVRAFGEQAGNELPKLVVRLDGKDVKHFDVKATIADPKVFEARVKVQAGKRKVAAAFTNDYYNPKDPDPNKRDRNLFIDYVEIEGPLNEPAPAAELNKRVFVVAPTEKNHAECARAIIENFARRAFRRPVTADEVKRLERFVATAEKNGESFERGVQMALTAVLVSPHFLFRVELDPEPNNPAAIHSINEFELASRLSYFLWSTMPDDELRQHAERGTLRTNLETQTRRMLRDAKAKALTENFAGQWLQLRNLRSMTPDQARFPAFDESLRSAMQKETELFFDSVVREDRNILEFLDSDYTFLNERLAKHYGIPGVKGNDFRRVALPDHRRGGIVTQASVLTVTSNPTRTSPVKRGKWILDNLLGTPPPPPPPDAGELKEEKGGALTGTLRQRMEQHRANPNCATCHQRMDPLGFGLENFDAVGGWREKEGDFPIDSSGTLPSGQSFRGPAELKGILKSKEEDFRRCLTEKTLTYALGRGLEYYDKRAVEQIAAAVAQNQNHFSSLVLEIVKSEPFQMRRGQQRGKK